MAYEPKSSNDTSVPQAFYALYLYPNQNGSGHVVFSLKLKTRRSTQKCVLQPMTQDIIDLVNKMGTEVKVKDWIQFSSIDADLYAADENDDDSCALDKDYESNNDKDVNDSDDDLSANEEWDEDDDSSESDDDDEPLDCGYDLHDGRESDQSSSTDDNKDDHNSNASEHEHQNDHFAILVNEPGDEESVNADELHDQDVERVNIVEADDSEEDNDVIEDATLFSKAQVPSNEHNLP